MDHTAMQHRKVQSGDPFQPQKQSKFRFFSGLTVGGLYALSFYFLLYCTREIFRVFSITEHYDLWVFSEAEVQFYNLFFAFIAALLGKSICFDIWLHGPKSIGKRNHRRTLTILVDQKVLVWFFLAWFSKLALGYAALVTSSYGTPDFYLFSFYPDYNYVFILIVIVLFLQQWTGFLLKYKAKGYKWMLRSAVVLSIFSIGISQINILDYQGLNQMILSQNVYDAYDLNLSKVKFYQVAKRQDRFEKLHMVQDEGSAPIFISGDNYCEFHELLALVLEKKFKRPRELRHLLTLQLNIGPTIKMEYVELLKEELALADISHLDFAVMPEGHELHEKYYLNHYFSIPNPPYFDFESRDVTHRFKIQIECTGPQRFLVNSKRIQKRDLEKHIGQLIAENPEYYAAVVVYPELDFKDYFFMIKSAREAVLNQRDEYCRENFGYSYMEMDNPALPTNIRKSKQEAIKKFPLRMLEERKGDFKVLKDYYQHRPVPPRPSVP